MARYPRGPLAQPNNYYTSEVPQWHSEVIVPPPKSRGRVGRRRSLAREQGWFPRALSLRALSCCCCCCGCSWLAVCFCLTTTRSSQQRAKRLRTHQPGDAPAQSQLLGRDQLLLKSPELQSRLGQRHCDESELLPLLLSHGLVGRVRAIEVTVHPLGETISIWLDTA
jgi:hypothetical protein